MTARCQRCGEDGIYAMEPPVVCKRCGRLGCILCASLREYTERVCEECAAPERSEE